MAGRSLCRLVPCPVGTPRCICHPSGCGLRWRTLCRCPCPRHHTWRLTGQKANRGSARICSALQRPGPKFEWRSVTASVAASANAAAVAEQPGGASGHARTTEQVGPEPWLRIPVARLVLLRDRRHAPHRPGIPRLAATQAACAVGRAARVAIEVEARPALAMLPLRPGAVVTARHHARTARKHSTWRAVEGIERRRGARYALEVDASLVARAITPFAPRVTARANAAGVSERAVRARGNARGVVKQRLDLRWTD